MKENPFEKIPKAIKADVQSRPDQEEPLEIRFDNTWISNPWYETNVGVKEVQVLFEYP